MGKKLKDLFFVKRSKVRFKIQKFEFYAPALSGRCWKVYVITVIFISLIMYCIFAYVFQTMIRNRSLDISATREREREREREKARAGSRPVSASVDMAYDAPAEKILSDYKVRNNAC